MDTKPLSSHLFQVDSKPPFLFPFLLFLLGAAVGSFLNVCIHRIPEGKSIVRPPSHCPSCGRAIRVHDKIPILSYLILRGRCRDCGWRIPIQYPLVESMGGLSLLALFLKFGWSLKVPIYFVFLSSLIVIAFIDARRGIIPDRVSLPILLIGLLLSPFHLGLWEAFLGAVTGGSLLFLIGTAYYHTTGREGMGGGDVKLLAMIGAFLGWKGALLSLFLGSLVGSMVGISMALWKGGEIGKTTVPFGPFLSLGAVVYLLLLES